MANDQINRLIELGVKQTTINHRDFVQAVAALAQESARSRVSAAAPVAFTDNSTGTADAGNALEAVPTVTPFVMDGATLVAPKAGFDTALAALVLAHDDLAAKTNEFIALIGGSTATLVTTLSGGSPDNTIAAISAALTGVTATGGLDATSGNVRINEVASSQASLAAGINWCRVAMGLSTITDNTGGLFSNGSGIAYPVPVVSATDPAVTTGSQSLAEAAVEATLTAAINNVATMAAVLNETRGTLAIGPFVVATSTSHTRFVNADVTV